MGKVHQDIFKGYLQHDLSGKNGLPLNVRIRQGIAEAYHVLLFSSYLLQNYFDELSVEYTRSKFRLMLRLSVIVNLCLMFSRLIRNHKVNSEELYLIYAIITITIVFYAYTFRMNKHESYAQASIIVGLVNILFALSISRSSTDTPLVHLPLLLSVFIPLTFNIHITITVFYCMTSQVLDNIYYNRLYKPENRELYHLTSSETDPHGVSRERTIHEIKRILTWLCVFIVMFHVSFWSHLRRRVAFLLMGQSLYARARNKRSTARQISWIDAIMPSVVSKEYIALRKKNTGLSSEMWVYSKPVDNVSILFADIVGFTRMSSSKTAQQVVYLLSDLYNSFDELCDATQCEKIATLGDCYYCVSGCPLPRKNHAECCIEMGLGMCRIIKQFNQVHSESVNMRVGIHTGKVNAAIIGQIRFRYDVYSYDVAIANSMESSGLPGRVHISETTYELIKHIYQVAPGDPMEVKTEQLSGIAGMVLKVVSIRTYFIDPKSSQLYRRGEKFGYLYARNQTAKTYAGQRSDLSDAHRLTQTLDNMLSSVKGEQLHNPPSGLGTFLYDSMKPVRSGKWRRKSGVQIKQKGLHFQNIATAAAIREHHKQSRGILFFINDLRNDPERRVEQFQRMPLEPITQVFLDFNLEKSYQYSFRATNQPVFLNSLQLAVLFDVIVLCSLISISQLLTWLHLSSLDKVQPRIIIVSILACLFATGTFVWSLWILHECPSSKYLKQIWLFSSHPVTRECILMFTAFVPCIQTVLISFWVSKQPNTSNWTHSLFVLLRDLSLTIHVVPLSSHPLVRLLGYIVCITTIGLTQNQSDSGWVLCVWGDNRSIVDYDRLFRFNMCEWFATGLMLYSLCRLNQHNCRLCFHVSHEARTCSLEAEKAQQEAEELLYNIIPKYVIEQMMIERHELNTGSQGTYAVSLPNIGIAFACISNFFATYYREDYKGGESALKLLNAIICSFDRLLSKPMFAEVEKIKTINDCYMVASGLNQKATTATATQDSDRRTHLVSLMDFCFMLLDTLNTFNTDYIIGSESFVLKVGYNIGPVTAGVIGTKKPMYDVWGDTVNVASRMYSTGKPGLVQVPNLVREILKSHYNFERIGETFVKGKGVMETFSCTQKKYM
ncbi:Adenylate cyclase type 9 [Fasciola gigantica]|uniref:Adenylate cyclase type 9 n=1 Tax=Fasciola gigantica TaxID=46835 RepID=A0A504ZB71_FASGI|nr:Adenylate cyclase type 9 [Fasciola gigantica]